MLYPSLFIVALLDINGIIENRKKHIIKSFRYSSCCSVFINLLKNGLNAYITKYIFINQYSLEPIGNIFIINVLLSISITLNTVKTVTIITL